MSWKITENINGIDWLELSIIMQRTGMGEREAAEVEAVFTGSYACCFAWQQQQLIGGARAISDGYRSSAIYDVFVDRPFQRQGVGHALMENLLARLPKRSVMLISIHGKEGFYQKLGFRRLRTAYILQEDFGPWSAMGYLDELEEYLHNG
ncbi:MAG: GNAT family N-acetyltransferase [Caldilineaceae bacterium]|nr:GNAT family N-acetyltransferase [Caldilineaceae bacterium]